MVSMPPKPLRQEEDNQTERAGKPLPYTLAKLRAVVTEAIAAGTCPCCDWALTEANFSVDHHNPISRDGDFSIGNILVCHLRCNKIKGNLTSHEFLHLDRVPRPVPARSRQGHLPPPVRWRPVHAAAVDERLGNWPKKPSSADTMLKTPVRAGRYTQNCVTTFTLVIAFLKGAGSCCRIASWLRPASSLPL